MDKCVLRIGECRHRRLGPAWLQRGEVVQIQVFLLADSLDIMDADLYRSFRGAQLDLTNASFVIETAAEELFNGLPATERCGDIDRWKISHDGPAPGSSRLAKGYRLAQVKRPP
ncbi:hypothetical protein NRY95_01565 [Xanthomonas campestris pv. phormiicola]|nr:hypothetical protein [Xanthomonas campestris pv. phormiicola]UYC16699.1 hypothetical protein NRY95_01565 [Xanthomonas campestris pv. phormiicola]